MSTFETVIVSYPQATIQKEQAAPVASFIAHQLYGSADHGDVFISEVQRRANVVAYQGPHVVGAASYTHDRQRGHSYLSDLVVSLELQRSGLGIGKLIMERVEADAIQSGSVEINLTPLRSSVPFYQNLGYTVRAVQKPGSEFIWRAATKKLS